jgi:hypothetical protein
MDRTPVIVTFSAINKQFLSRSPENISASGKESMSVDASTLANCAYQYSLCVNDKLINSKQMVTAK